MWVRRELIMRCFFDGSRSGPRQIPLVLGFAALLVAGTAQAQTPGWWVRMTTWGGIPAGGAPSRYLDAAGEPLEGLSGDTVPIIFDGAVVQPVINANGGGNYPDDLPYPDGTAGGSNAVSAFLIRARTTARIPAGTWTIAFGSDDGGQITIPGVTFTSRFNANGTQAPERVLYDADRGHAWTGG